MDYTCICSHRQPPRSTAQRTSTALPVRFSLTRRLHDINAAQWNRLAGDHPLVRHEFLLALDDTGCATPQTGWAPHFLLMHRGNGLAGAMPLYLKFHSRGEYVFDHAWAQAFERQGLNYYPKLLGAIPFTPVPGPRLLAASHEDRVLLARKAIEISEQNGVSSLHILFPGEEDSKALEEAGFLFRRNVQFHWFNQGYGSLDDFLGGLNQQKRKKLKQDSKKVMQAGVQFRWLQGRDIDDQALDFFYRCYTQTYLEHGNAPYLTPEFFQQLRGAMPESMVLVLAEQEGKPVASALNLRSERTLYGRYWGSMRYIPGLHFETCYMQGIAYCIDSGLAVFEGGAQGEHKLSRGMLPVKTCSAHWISDRRYAEAIADFLARESPAVDAYIGELAEHSPFKKNPEAG
ncbi:GNAT family N-acetyltransferase [Pollutimonas sp. M17]|uniref:GNAT family N-acetyltransferase n=1 Tax=Pollutimonas sp. M17 TaxID=2962065 RepID=UPI00398EEBB3